MIQEEKESTELRAEEIETRVTSGSMEALNLTQLRKRGSIPTSLTALSLASASPPLSGRSTPKLTSRSTAQDLDRMGVMTLVRAAMGCDQWGCDRWGAGHGTPFTSAGPWHLSPVAMCWPWCGRPSNVSVPSLLGSRPACKVLFWGLSGLWVPEPLLALQDCGRHWTLS